MSRPIVFIATGALPWRRIAAAGRPTLDNSGKEVSCMRTYSAPVLVAHGAVAATLGPRTGMTVESFNHWS